MATGAVARSRGISYEANLLAVQYTQVFHRNKRKKNKVKSTIGCVFLLTMPSSFHSLLVTALLVLAATVMVLQFFRRTTQYEGFTQLSPYSLERGAGVYDEFYCDIYDRLYKGTERNDVEAKQITQATFADPAKDLFLDVGCGTGGFVQALTDLGFSAVGVDRSGAMLAHANRRLPAAAAEAKEAKAVETIPSKSCGSSQAPPQWKQGDILDPLLFDSSVFSHITCLHETVHELDNRPMFFRNCRRWLRTGGYFVVQIADGATFDPIVPLGRPAILRDVHLTKSDGTLLTDTAIDFRDFQYVSRFDVDRWHTDGVIVQRETFTDTATHKIRENERTLHIPYASGVIEDEIESTGFAPVGQFNVQGDTPRGKGRILCFVAV